MDEFVHPKWRYTCQDHSKNFPWLVSNIALVAPLIIVLRLWLGNNRVTGITQRWGRKLMPGYVPRAINNFDKDMTIRSVERRQDRML